MAGRPQRDVKKPQRFTEFFAQSSSSEIQKQKCNKRDSTLYDIEVTEVDKERKRLKIHYVGYNEKYDEWRPYDGKAGESFPFVRSEKLFVPTKDSFEDRLQSFHNNVYREIKKKLRSWRREDPEVCVDLNVDQDVFEAGLGSIPGRMYPGRTVFTMRSNRMMDPFLGLKWDERILNENGDFAYVVEGTIRYWLGKRSPIVEFKYIGNKLIKSEIENSYFLTFQFVRGDGNKFTYNEMN